MNVINKFLIPALALGMFAACSDDNKFEGPETPDNNNPCFVSVDLNLAVSGGRAVGNPPTEVGQDFENAINNAVIVFAEPTTNRMIAAAKVTQIAGSGNAKPTVTAKFTQSELETFRATITEGENANVNVFALCNCTETLVSELTAIKYGTNNTYWIEKYSEYQPAALTVDAIKTNGVFMTSYTATNWTLPAKEELANTSASNPANVGEITVKRAIARFDYAEGATGGKYCVYDASEDDNISDDNTSKINVEIVRVATVNVSKHFWNFPHFAANADGVANAKAFETGVLVADYKGEEKTSTNAANGTWMSNNYTSTLFTFGENNSVTLNRAGWTSIAYTDLVKNDRIEDNWTATEGTTPDYRIWRYVTENVIPVNNNQINGLSTGIVFKGKISVEGEGKVAKQFDDAMKAKKTLYVFSGTTNVAAIGALSDIVALGTENAIYQAMEQCLVTGKSMTDTNLADADVDKTKATKAGFKMYEPAAGDLVNGDVAGEYYMYYYYWNKHNDNNDASLMGQMEFATVRNHVYKLSLTKISKFGHPRKPENDPDPVTPTTPDEDASAYITVSLVILPWDVRVNNIEF